MVRSSPDGLGGELHAQPVSAAAAAKRKYMTILSWNRSASPTGA
jgi:hypothetical protein